jgi:hypothetical protein
MAELDDRFKGWMYNWSSFSIEKNQFEEDVHILILGTLHAGITYLNAEAERENAKLEPHLKTASREGLERIGEIHAEIYGYLAGQERFLRNMALVALIARLTHAINSMIRSADDVAARKAEGYGGNDEFQKLWRELDERFGVKCPPKHIAFIEGFRRARNLIVHSGGEANPLKSGSEIDSTTEFEDMRDTSFSSKYPKFVDGEGYNAEVQIIEKQLDYAIRKSVELVKWLAVELRTKQKDHQARLG